MSKRLDLCLVEHGLAPSRERAKELIRAGQVMIGDHPAGKPSQKISEEEETRLSVQGETLPYVSRGGLKLEKALDVFNLDLRGLVCMDVGASTGGFTDCMLQKGAGRIYAVDVGTSQLSPLLGRDPRVISMENTNMRYLKGSDLPEVMDFLSADVSFISLKLLFPAMVDCLKEGGKMVCLIKPQFEAGRADIGKKGIVKDKRVHERVIREVMESAEGCGLRPLGHTVSPIRGAKGNVEYLACFEKKTDEEFSDHYK